MNIKAKDIASQYGNARMVVDRLNYLGIGRVREGFPARELSGHARACYEIIADAGIKYNLTTHNEKPMADIIADIAAFERRHPGAVIAVEGPNELNNWPISYQGLKGAIAGKTYMSDLYAALKAQPTLAAANVPVYGATDWPSLATKADLANVHSYERNAYGSYERLRKDRDAELAAYAADVVTPPGPAPRWVVTETGFHTWLGSGYFEGVDPRTQAKLGLNLFFNVVKLGGEATYWYQLLDAWGPPRNGEEAFGVFDHKGEPKPLAIALHNLTAILADHGDAAAVFATTPLRYTLSGSPGRQPGEGVHHLLMQRSDGAHLLAIWREGRIWDMDADRPIAMAPQAVTLSLGRTASRVEVYDPIAGKAPIATLANVAQVDLPLGDHLMIIKVD